PLDSAARYQGPESGPCVLALAPGGRTLATSDDGRVRLWNTETAKLLWQSPALPQPVAVAISPDGRFVATGAADGVIRLWEGQRVCELRDELFTIPVTTLVFQANSTILAAASSAGTSVWLW